MAWLRQALVPSGEQLDKFFHVKALSILSVGHDQMQSEA